MREISVSELQFIRDALQEVLDYTHWEELEQALEIAEAILERDDG